MTRTLPWWRSWWPLRDPHLATLQRLAADGRIDLAGCTARLVDDVERREAAARLRDGELQRLRALANDRLHLGCGNHPMDGWTNIDGGDATNYRPPDDPRVIKLDVFTALAALPAGSVGFVHNEQFLEHFTRQDGHRLLRECARVLRPGGVIRTQVPDLEQVVRLYRDEVEFAPWATVQYPHRMRHIANTVDPYGRLVDGERYLPAMMINNGFHMDGHRFLYDFATLEQSLRLAGFTDIGRCEFGRSRHPELDRIDHHDGGDSGRSWVPRVALTVEATRPAS